MDYIKEKLYQQLAIDYCCQVSDIKDAKNHFTEYEKLEGRRQFEEADDCVLKVIAVKWKADIYRKKRALLRYAGSSFPTIQVTGLWMPQILVKLDEILMNDGYRVKTAHPIFYSQR